MEQSQVRYKKVPAKVPEKVLGGFGAEPGRLQQGSGERSGEGLRGFFVADSGQIQQGSGGSGKGQALVQSQLKFKRVSEKVLVKISGGFGAEPGQVQQGSGDRSGEGPGSFVAEPGQVQQGSGKFSVEGQTLVQSQVKFNRVPEKVPVKVGEALVQSQVGFNRVPEPVPEEAWEALKQSFNRVPKQGSGRLGEEPNYIQQI